MWQIIKTWDWKAIVVCLLTSLVVWVLNALNESNYSTLINYPVSVEIKQNDSIVALQPPPEFLSVLVSGSGWQLLRSSFSFSLQPLTIRIQNPLESRPLSTLSYHLLLSDLLKTKRLKFLGIREDSIRFRYDKLETRLLPISFDSSSVQPDNGYLKVSRVLINPSFVRVTAPQSAWKNAPSMLTVAPTQPNDNLQASFQADLSLPMATKSPLERRNAQSVSVSFEVAACETRIVDLPIRAEGQLPQNVRLALESIKLQCFVKKGLASTDSLAKLYYRLDLGAVKEGATNLTTSIENVQNIFVGCYYPHLLTDSLRIDYDKKKKAGRHNGRYR